MLTSETLECIQWETKFKGVISYNSAYRVDLSPIQLILQKRKKFRYTSRSTSEKPPKISNIDLEILVSSTGRKWVYFKLPRLAVLFCHNHAGKIISVSCLVENNNATIDEQTSTATRHEQTIWLKNVEFKDNNNNNRQGLLLFWPI